VAPDWDPWRILYSNESLHKYIGTWKLRAIVLCNFGEFLENLEIFGNFGNFEKKIEIFGKNLENLKNLEKFGILNFF
jgi:hypothetical protein